MRLKAYLRKGLKLSGLLNKLMSRSGQSEQQYKAMSKLSQIQIKNQYKKDRLFKDLENIIRDHKKRDNAKVHISDLHGSIGDDLNNALNKFQRKFINDLLFERDKSYDGIIVQGNRGTG